MQLYIFECPCSQYVSGILVEECVYTGDVDNGLWLASAIVVIKQEKWSLRLLNCSACFVLSGQHSLFVFEHALAIISRIKPKCYSFLFCSSLTFYFTAMLKWLTYIQKESLLYRKCFVIKFYI